MTRVLLPKDITFSRDDGEQLAYVLGRLENLIATRDDPFAYQVTQALTPGATTECLAAWVSAIRSVLCRKLHPTKHTTAPKMTPKQSPFRP